MQYVLSYSSFNGERWDNYRFVYATLEIAQKKLSLMKDSLGIFDLTITEERK